MRYDFSFVLQPLRQRRRPVFGLRSAFQDDLARQMVTLRDQILHRYGCNAYLGFQAFLWWGWNYRIDEQARRLAAIADRPIGGVAATGRTGSGRAGTPS